MIKLRNYISERKQQLLMLFACTVSFLLLHSLMPNIAFAIVDGIIESINDWLVSVLLSAAESMFNFFLSNLAGLTVESVLNRPFDALMGDGSTPMWNMLSTFRNVAIIPVAGTILGFGILFQMVSIGKNWDKGDGDLATVMKDFIWLVVYFVLFTWAINYSDQLLIAIYEVIQFMVAQLIGNPNTDTVAATITLDADSVDFHVGEALLLLFFGVITLFFGSLAYGVAIGIGWYRAFQLWIMFTLAPIAIAFFSHEQTRPWGVGFIKWFISTCLAIVVTVLVLMIFPSIAVVVAGNIDWAHAAIHSATALLLALINLIVLTLAAIAIILGSGKIARDLLGG